MLRELKKLRLDNFDRHWRLGELTSVQAGDQLLSLYSFEVNDIAVLPRHWPINWNLYRRPVTPGCQKSYKQRRLLAEERNLKIF